MFFPHWDQITKAQKNYSVVLYSLLFYNVRGVDRVKVTGLPES